MSSGRGGGSDQALWLCVLSGSEGLLDDTVALLYSVFAPRSLPRWLGSPHHMLITQAGVLGDTERHLQPGSSPLPGPQRT